MVERSLKIHISLYPPVTYKHVNNILCMYTRDPEKIEKLQSSIWSGHSWSLRWHSLPSNRPSEAIRVGLQVIYLKNLKVDRASLKTYIYIYTGTWHNVFVKRTCKQIDIIYIYILFRYLVCKKIQGSCAGFLLGIQWLWFGDTLNVQKDDTTTQFASALLGTMNFCTTDSPKCTGVEQIGHMNIEWPTLRNYRFLWRSRWFEVPISISPNRNKAIE